MVIDVNYIIFYKKMKNISYMFRPENVDIITFRKINDEIVRMLHIKRFMDFNIMGFLLSQIWNSMREKYKNIL